jgi:hypothetical protein
VQENQPKRRVGRRGLLRGVGAGALATSAVVFGTSQPASAHEKHYACCHLVFTPSSYATCRDSKNYTWYCRWTQTTGCGCCERIGSSGNYTASAYHCDRT